MPSRKTVPRPTFLRRLQLDDVAREFDRLLDEIALAPRWEEHSGYKLMEDVYLTEVGEVLWLTKNASYDGTTWLRLDTSEPAFAIVIELGAVDSFSIKAAGSGTGAITWSNVLEVGVDEFGVFGQTPVGQQGPLTAQDGATVDGTYGTEEAGVIDNNRTRIAEIETALQNLGHLQ